MIESGMWEIEQKQNEDQGQRGMDTGKEIFMEKSEMEVSADIK